MSRTLKRLLISSVLILSFCGCGQQLYTHAETHANKAHVSTKISGRNYSSSQAVPHIVKKQANHIVLHQIQQELHQHLRDLPIVHLPSSWTHNDKDYYYKLASRNQNILQQERAFAKQRSKYHYRTVASNTRDLGGYTVLQGKYVIKPHRLIRSNDLHKLTPRGNSYLHNQLQLKNVIDLRNPEEINKSPDVNTGVKDNNYSVYSQQAMKDAKQNDKAQGITSLYKGLYSTTPQAKQAYTQALSKIYNNHSGAILYHCIQGRDRTGITSILTLSALGAPRSEITKDYLLTNYYAPRQLFTEQLKSINNFYTAVNQKYVNMAGFLDDLGMTQGKRKNLRSNYLEKSRITTATHRNVNHKGKTSNRTPQEVHKKSVHHHADSHPIKHNIRHIIRDIID